MILKKNIESSKKTNERKEEKQKSGNYRNSPYECPIPDYNSVIIRMMDPTHHYSARSPDPKLVRLDKVTINKDMIGCGCENVFKNGGIEVDSKYAMDGFFYEKNEKLFFKKLKEKDILFYSKNKPDRQLMKNEDGSLSVENDFKQYEENRAVFFEKLKSLEKGSIEVKEKFKCSPLIKYILKERVVVTSGNPFEMVNNTMKNINLCNMTIEKK